MKASGLFPCSARSHSHSRRLALSLTQAHAFCFHRFILVPIDILRGYKLYPDLNKPEKPLVRAKVFSHAIEMMHHPVSSRILCLNRALGLCFSVHFQLMWWQGHAHGRLDSGTKKHLVGMRKKTMFWPTWFCRLEIVQISCYKCLIV